MIKFRLNELLAEKRKTGRSLALYLGIHENSVSRLRRRRIMPQLDSATLSKICEFLECKTGDLLEYVPDSNEKS